MRSLLLLLSPQLDLMPSSATSSVVPAKAGTQAVVPPPRWMPASAGMTSLANAMKEPCTSLSRFTAWKGRNLKNNFDSGGASPNDTRAGLIA